LATPRIARSNTWLFALGVCRPQAGEHFWILQVAQRDAEDFAYQGSVHIVELAPLDAVFDESGHDTGCVAIVVIDQSADRGLSCDIGHSWRLPRRISALERVM